ncbi:hypothetical protein BN12_2210002 [Nostocoides japonicum T1-X7]|uniref:Uncharacterized protein n=1 Tax=Nostocoides japonicum T1-X7 TaxID=1194083 RepID=A0A077LXZ5_9MICO|nr:hypothetical protein BN12_2210002 [Tetrasphaera japonica T1-X7]
MPVNEAMAYRVGDRREALDHGWRFGPCPQNSVPRRQLTQRRPIAPTIGPMGPMLILGCPRGVAEVAVPHIHAVKGTRCPARPDIVLPACAMFPLWHSYLTFAAYQCHPESQLCCEAGSLAIGSRHGSVEPPGMAGAAAVPQR